MRPVQLPAALFALGGGVSAAPLIESAPADGSAYRRHAKRGQSRYMPHNGKQEIERRLRQAARAEERAAERSAAS
jgi:hypothetical protein